LSSRQNEAEFALQISRSGLTPLPGIVKLSRWRVHRKSFHDRILRIISDFHAGHRFPPAVISCAVWLYFRFPLSLRMVEEMLAARSVEVTYETVRQWALGFGQQAA
jgi:putative transposase